MGSTVVDRFFIAFSCAAIVFTVKLLKQGIKPKVNGILGGDDLLNLNL
jgi:hypothetical protein